MRKLLCLLVLVAVAGCSPIEGAKKVWGSSTEALERERANAIRKSYSCALADCFNAVKSLTLHKAAPKGAEAAVAQESTQVGGLETFIEKENMLVVVGVPGSVDTTEVGIFFNPVKTNLTSIEVSSLSSSAKRKVSEMVDLVLETKFPSAQ